LFVLAIAEFEGGGVYLGSWNRYYSISLNLRLPSA